jgi:hypothetical protein
MLFATAASFAAPVDRHGVVVPPARYVHGKAHVSLHLLPFDVAAYVCAQKLGRVTPGCAFPGPVCNVIAPVDDHDIIAHELAHCNGWHPPGL